MKTLTTFLLFLICSVINAQTNSIIITGSAGVHNTQTKILGTNPMISENKLYTFTPIAATRIFKTGKKTHGLFIGLSGSADAIKVKTTTQNSFGSFNSGSMSSKDVLPRFEIGYHLISKKIYFNNLFAESNKRNSGFYTQLQPYVGASYSKSNKTGGGSIGATSSTNDYDLLEIRNYPRRVPGVVYGMNLYFGKQNKPWFFINVSHNINFVTQLSNAVFTGSTNGIITKNNVTSTGSGFTISGGLILYSFKYKK